MRKNYDKPKYIDVKRNDQVNENTEHISDIIRDILENQSFAVLATRGEENCYTSLITFANNKNLTKIAFASPIETKKLNLWKKIKKYLY